MPSMSKQGQIKILEEVLHIAELREEQQRIAESDDSDWIRWWEIEDEIRAIKGESVEEVCERLKKARGEA